MLTIILLLCIALLTMDWLQTRVISKNPERFTEANPILGKHPSLRAVNIYFACCVVATVALAWLLPYWLAIGAGVALAALEAFVTLRNHRLGIRMV